MTSKTHSMFPILGTSTHAALDCNDCHGAFDSFLQFTCTDCHAHDQTVTDQNHADVTNYAYDSASCFSCHADGTATGVDHASIFLIGAGSKHSTAHCADCHIDATNRKNVGCTSDACHPNATMASGHSRVLSGSGGYVWNTADCLDCHSTPDVFSVSSHNNCVSHKGARCRTCHTSALATKPFPATNFSTQSCTACHGNRGSSCNGD